MITLIFQQLCLKWGNPIPELLGSAERSSSLVKFARMKSQSIKRQAEAATGVDAPNC